MAINLDLIKSKLDGLQSTTTKNTKLWKPKPGKNTIRIVPYQFNKENPFVELLFHYNIGRKQYLSLETFGENDPIVEFAEKLKSTGDKNDWKLSKKLEPKLRTFVPIVVRGEEAEGVKFWGFGKQIYQELLSFIADPDYGDITDVSGGRDIIVDYQTPKEANNTFGKITIRIKPNPSPVTTEKAIAELIAKGQTDINTIYTKTTYDELKTALEGWLSPENQAELAKEDAARKGNSPQDAPAAPANAPVKAPASNAKEVDEAFDDLFN